MEVSATLPAATPSASQSTFIRVRADVLDKLVDQAGEVAIARSKLENEVGTIKSSLGDLTENIQRLRSQLREVEIQADAQLQARGDRLSRDSADFDPLEFDRYTRLQELTRMLAESVEDVAMVQSNMLKGLQSADADLTAQSRLTRELQQQLMRVRLVPFSNISERLYRVARQASKELDKRVNLDVRGASTELDRGVLEKMAGPFEHLIRNAIVHGLETPDERRAAGKPETGELVVDVKPEGNEIIIVVSDDGAGLDLKRIRERAIERDLITPDQELGDRELMELIFQPGFTTVTEVTELAGRGVGMDVVRAELASFGGRVAIASEPGRGTRFTLYLPMTLAVAQVVLAKVGARRYAIPAGMVEQVRRYRPATLVSALGEGIIDISPVGQVVLRPLSQLVGEESPPHLTKQTPVVLLKSADDRLAVAVDDVSSNQEVVVKNVGAQVARLAGILGATILGSGEIVLIINPVQLITRAPEPPVLAAGGGDARRSDGRRGRSVRLRRAAHGGRADHHGRRRLADGAPRDATPARTAGLQRDAGEGRRRRAAAAAGREARRDAGRHRDAEDGRLRPDAQRPRHAGDGRHPDHHDHVAHGGEAPQQGVRTGRERVPRQALPGRRTASPAEAVLEGEGDRVGGSSAWGL